MTPISNQSLHQEDFKKAVADMETYIDVSLDDLIHIHELAQKHAQLRRLEQLSVLDIATTNLEMVNPKTSIRDAAQILLEYRISGLPVIDDNQQLVGIVTEADFLTAIGIPCHQPTRSLWDTLDSFFQQSVHSPDKPLYVADIMSAKVITILPEQTLWDVIHQMKSHQIKRLIVINEQRHAIGIITRSNLIQVLLQQFL